MPTYDFICENCGHKFSEFVSLREKDSVKCPVCNGKAKQRFTGFMYMGKGGTESGGCSGSCGSCSGCG
ncbi:hypothetical protein AN618_20240 [Fervidicola ferrireducens]|uniref:Putative regulatory protein FmdB zinc ribbon domain-containing protein n=1 Tax=Fervidicola ferrireducens TaxID=520764 RepID=A0A140L3M9_9FIRM|nr:zinc ribbon domain-containing protein [Fervidicola ferrireducens]KXG75154.1 hypothetical protein AN618_20240 [Fervidicola ferrireducens]